MSAVLVNAIGFTAGTLNIVSTFPQLFRVRRLQSGAGVSLGTWLLLFTGSVIWCAYGIRFDSAPQLVTNSINGILIALLLLSLTRIKQRSLVLMFIYLGGLAAFWGSLMLFMPAWLASGLLIILTASRIPQVLVSWRTLQAGRFSAVSVPTWIVAFSATTLWLIYAIVDSRTTVIVTALISMFCSAMICGLEIVGTKRYQLSIKSSTQSEYLAQ